MQRHDKIGAMREAVRALKAGGRRIAFVPTMGALHAGHASLLRLAREKGDAVVVSAFVNPLQFGPSEDYAKYPRTPSSDTLLCEKENVDVLFTPSAEEMFPRGFSTHLQEDAVSRHLCGIARPALFRGVLTCWLKLFNIVRPEVVVMGEKDAQQVAVLRKVAADLLLPLEIVTGPVVRDVDGLAVSARNTYLTPTQREEALAVFGALRKAKEMVETGVKSADRLVAEVTHLIASKRRLRVIYISVVDRNTMEQLREISPGHCLLAISYWVDEVRLTDNMAL
ncbi:MAG: pantoate--beta-alanine ligase [Opitutae bacterium]|nr:pantoate--beta-alanine ligase [Opitutae bacterium]